MSPRPIVLVVENNKLPRASASLSFDNPLIYEGDVAGVSSILAEMIGNGTQSISKENFIEEVDYMGASVSVTGSGAFAASLKRYFPEANYFGYDSHVNNSEISKFGLIPINDLNIAFQESDMVLILNNHPDFGSMPINEFSSYMNKPSIIYDFWNNFH